MPQHDIAIIGGGIVGLATAMALTRKGCRNIVVLEAEPRLASHQTGHNSGVIHAGLYYKPGSLKARLCVEGRDALCRFCDEHNVPFERCGKVVVAVTDDERPALDELERRGKANGLTDIRRVSPEEMREREPHVSGVAGLLVPYTGIVDFVQVAEAYARLIREEGVDIRTGAAVSLIHPESGGFRFMTESGEFKARSLINCAGLYSDRIARMAGLRPDVRIIPFRGTYVALTSEAERLVRHLIYPVPDPQFPFLGVHFTRMIGGGVEAGPNAVLTFRRNWYEPGDDGARDFSMFRYGGFWRMVRKYGRVGARELWRSRSQASFVRALQRLIPEIRAEDVKPHGSGIRAQAVARDGALVDDFRIMEANRQIHVLNAPSPAATASISIGRVIAEKAAERFS